MAFTYYKQAADLNNPVGYFNVGKYFIEKEQYKAAVEYLLKAKALGYTKASIQLSNMYLKGLGYRKNKKKAFKFLNQAVEENDISAMHQLGSFYLKGIGCKKDEKLALKYFQLSSDNNMSEGMRLLGTLYLDAKHIKKEYENGFFWLDKAAVAGNIEAIVRMKKLYTDSHPHLRKKSLLYLQEMEFYYDELLAKKDDLDALVRVSFIYYEGNKFAKTNYEKANMYFVRLYDLDHTAGYFGLGLTKLYGRGIKTNYEEAKNLLEIASTRGDIQAMNALGEIHRLGYGVTVNYQRAKDYYFEAAKSDETNALINLGLLNYRKQIQGAKNELAFQYMLTAADKGNSLAYYWLGIFYDKGIGTELDFKKAEVAFKKAIEANNLGAGYKYAQMLFEHVQTVKLNRKKKNIIYEEIRDLLINYINSPHTSDVNSMYSMYTLGQLYNLDNFDLKSTKISRYYYELAAEKKLTKAMVRMFYILIEKEPKVAVGLIQEAIKRPSDGESLYVMGNLLYEGHELIEKNELKAKEFYGKAAGLNYQLAKEKLAML